MSTNLNPHFSGVEELTDQRVQRLCLAITSERVLRTLGVIGLQLEVKFIDTNIFDYRNDIATAAYYTLKEWLLSKRNRKIAYKELCEALALKDVNMSFLIEQMDG